MKPQPPAVDRLLRPKEAGELLSISDTQVKRLIHAGKLGYVMVGAQDRAIPLSEIQRFIHEGIQHETPVPRRK